MFLESLPPYFHSLTTYFQTIATADLYVSPLSCAVKLPFLICFSRIIVFKDGQIVEQGTHSELIAQDGVFATMWADQVSSSDAASSHKKDITGYSVNEEQTKTEQDTADFAPLETAQVAAVTAESTEADGQQGEETTAEFTAEAPEAAPIAGSEAAAESVKAAPVAFPSSDSGPEIAITFPASTSTPISFPVSDSPRPAPIAFPGSVDDTASQHAPSLAERATSPGVTFQNVATPPRIGTPDVDQDGKRRRTLSTQGMQRLARRISLSGRRQGSTSNILTSAIQGLKREGTSTSKDTDSAKGSDSVRASTDAPRDSPGGSLPDVTKSPKLKKKDKEKKRKSTIG